MASKNTSSLWRLKFKSNNQLESANRKRDKRDLSRKIKPIPPPETCPSENDLNQSSVPKVAVTQKPIAKPKTSGDGVKRKRRESERKEGNLRKFLFSEIINCFILETSRRFEG